MQYSVKCFRLISLCPRKLYTFTICRSFSYAIPRLPEKRGKRSKRHNKTSQQTYQIQKPGPIGGFDIHWNHYVIVFVCNETNRRLNSYIKRPGTHITCGENWTTKRICIQLNDVKIKHVLLGEKEMHRNGRASAVL